MYSLDIDNQTIGLEVDITLEQREMDHQENCRKNMPTAQSENVPQIGAPSLTRVTVDLVVKLEDESFSLLEIPESKSALVKKHEDLVLTGIDLDSLVTDLSMVGKFTRIAYNGVAGYTDLQIKIRRIGVNVSQLCDKSAMTVGKFLQTSEAILLDLQTTYQFLIDGMEDMAIVTLESTATIAKGMATAAEQLAAAFDEEAKRVSEVLEDTQRTRNSAVEEKKLEEDEAEKHQKDKEDAQRKRSEFEKQIDKHEQEYDKVTERQVENERSKGFIWDIVDSITGRSAEMARAALEEKEMHLKEMKELQEKRSKVIQDYHQFSMEIKKCGENGELLETAIPSLHKAMGGLTLLSDAMRKISYFWKKLEMECAELGNDNTRKLIETAMHKPEAYRLTIWGSTPFKTRAICYYARWVALGNICRQYVERIKLTQRELYEQHRENLTKDEAKQNVVELADTFVKELEANERKDDKTLQMVTIS